MRRAIENAFARTAMASLKFAVYLYLFARLLDMIGQSEFWGLQCMTSLKITACRSFN
jgi:hypothetical protein